VKWSIVTGRFLVLLVRAGTIVEARTGDITGSYVGAAVCLVIWGIQIAEWWEKLK
jgi:hypothetical protein